MSAASRGLVFQRSNTAGFASLASYCGRASAVPVPEIEMAGQHMDGELKRGRAQSAPEARLDHRRKQSPPVTLSTRKMANSLDRVEPIRARPPLFLDAELTQMVSDLTRDVERFDSLVHSQRRLLQHRTKDGAKAERQWQEIRARVGIITTKVHAILDEIALPVADS